MRTPNCGDLRRGPILHEFFRMFGHAAASRHGGVNSRDDETLIQKLDCCPLNVWICCLGYLPGHGTGENGWFRLDGWCWQAGLRFLRPSTRSTLLRTCFRFLRPSTDSGCTSVAMTEDGGSRHGTGLNFWAVQPARKYLLSGPAKFWGWFY